VVHPAGPFRIKNKTTVVDKKGRVFVSYGTTVPGLSGPSFDPLHPGPYVRTVVTGKDIAKIKATARYWCSNTARLQVSQYNVTRDGSTCDTAFLTDALDAEVRAAENARLVVVINDNTKSDPAAASERDPTPATFTFWKCVIGHREHWSGGRFYGSDPQVIFDIFNEPWADYCARNGNPSSPNPYNMQLWRNGGTGPCTTASARWCMRSITRTSTTATCRSKRRRGGRSSGTW